MIYPRFPPGTITESAGEPNVIAEPEAAVAAARVTLVPEPRLITTIVVRGVGSTIVAEV
jgi:hypothetical protein